MLWLPTPEFKATIETAIDRYRKLDLVGISAQTHAMLSATTGILRWYEMQHRPRTLRSPRHSTSSIAVWP